MSPLLVRPSAPPVVLHALTYPYRKCADVGRAPGFGDLVEQYLERGQGGGGRTRTHS